MQPICARAGLVEVGRLVPVTLTCCSTCLTTCTPRHMPISYIGQMEVMPRWIDTRDRGGTARAAAAQVLAVVAAASCAGMQNVEHAAAVTRAM